MSKNYIICVERTAKSSTVVFWRAANSGYTSNLEEAGQYPDELIKEGPRNKDYYNNGKETIAVPCDLVDKVSSRILFNDHQTLSKVLHLLNK